MSTTSSASTTYFTGQSSYAADLNNSISRAVAIATLPVTELQNQESTLVDQQSEIQTLGSVFVSVQSSIDALDTAAASNSYSASVDVPAVASASVSSGALAGTYSLNVLSLGSHTNTISPKGSTTVTDPTRQNISSASTFTLTLNGKAYALTPSGTSLQSLVTAINSSGAAVQATVVNVGGSASPDYRLSVQSTQYAPYAIDLGDGSNSLLTSLSTGAYVTYQVNGQPSTPVNATSRTLSLSTGLTAQVSQTGTTDITVAQNSSGISSGLAAFANAYNAGVDELIKNRGQNGGSLTGNSLISELQASLNLIGAYNLRSSGSVSSLADLGLTFDQNGHLQFNQSTFGAVAAASPSSVTSFLGSKSGGGFLQTAFATLKSLTDGTSGSITSAGNTIGNSITNLTKLISNKQSQVTQLQTTLTTQMAKADAAISSLQGQVTQITSLFAAQLQASRNITG